jgi:glutathione synthase
MPLRLAILMDPIAHIKPAKDSSFAMMLEAQRRGHDIYYCTPFDLALRDGAAYGRLRSVRVRDQPSDFHELGESQWTPLAELDVILIRTDPPFDSQYLYNTLVLDQARRDGVQVVNNPQTLRDANEKLFALQFPTLCPTTLVARDATELKRFVKEQGRCVAKVLDGMGGAQIFQIQPNDPNLNVIFETLTREGRDLALVQRYIPQITEGDKRILLIDGVAIPYALARIPQGDEFRGNMARGGKAVARPLSARDQEICAILGPQMTQRGLRFVGLDVIGDFLTEINVTSPTGIRELDKQCGLNVAGVLFDALERSA